MSNKKISWVVLGCAILGMGLGMPGCPNQEIQQQMELLKSTNAELTKKVQAMNTELTSLSNDVNQIKQLLPQITGVMTGQKTAIDSLDTAVKELQAKVLKGGKKKK